MRIRLYIAASVDGYIAPADGSVDWLKPFDGEGYGYEAFMKEVSTLVVGRKTFDQMLTFGAWPHPDQDTYVLTSRPLGDVPPRVHRWEDDAPSLVAHLRGASLAGDVWLVGGGLVVDAFLAMGAIDEIELFVIPVLLGDGIPLFPKNDRFAGLRLTDSTVYKNGVTRLVYAP
ncbi:MAG: dihydrofolate reductase family protein [Deltaproteobacteria bacterium]|nr:dihydrofolate reductase family protein [Deltaproteobacteria bacterium]